jgi:hypothetical protein
MPNWVTNKVVITGKAETITKIIEFIKGEDRPIDFDKIVPMPAELHGTRSPVEKRDPFLIAKYGSDNWYDWACQNWGTKWNASGSQDVKLNEKGNRLTIVFDTAWATPAPVIEALSEKFPDVKINVWYADEDFGSNVGKYGFINGMVSKDEPLDGLPSGRRLARQLLNY